MNDSLLTRIQKDLIKFAKLILDFCFVTAWFVLGEMLSDQLSTSMYLA